MGLYLQVGELPSVAWDWLLFNNQSDEHFRMEGLAMAVYMDVRGVQGTESTMGNEESYRKGTMYFPTVRVGQGFLGYCLDSMSACMGQMLNIGTVVGERAYGFLRGPYPTSVISARFSSGYIVITETCVEDIHVNKPVKFAVVHPDEPYTVLRPMELLEVGCCGSCGQMVTACRCAGSSQGHHSERDMERDWRAIQGPTPVFEPTRYYAQFVAFERMQATKYPFYRSAVKIGEDGLKLGWRGQPEARATAGFDIFAGSHVEHHRVVFLSRMVAQWGIRPPLVASAGQGPGDHGGALQSWSSSSGMMSPSSVPLLAGGDNPGETTALAQTGRSARRPSSWACDVPGCGANFSRQSELGRHRLSVHEKVRDFRCDTCGQAFSLRQHLKSHVATVHEGRRDYTCHRCDRKFPTKAKVDRHIRGVHDKERNYPCPDCNRRFFQPSDVDRHRARSHSQDPPAADQDPSPTDNSSEPNNM